MKKIKFDSVGVQAALIIVIGTIIVAAINIVNSRSALYQENNSLKQKVEEQKGKIESLKTENLKITSEMQRLETQLTPFKTIALEKYTGSEQEALEKLADALETLEEKTDTLEKRLAPRSLSVEQLSILTEKINKIKDIKINFLLIASDPEAKSFKNQIQESLEKGGWTIEKNEIAVIGAFEGITLFASQDPPNKAVKTLYLALKDFGFEILLTRNINLPENVIGIKIGKKK